MTHVEEKMASLLKQLQELSDPSPAEFHPDQEDWDLLTGARVSQSRTYDDEGVEKGSVSIRSSRVSKTRKRLAEFESDPRYAGKTVSRKELYGYENEEIEIDQSSDELKSGDEQEGLERAGSDTTSDHSETDQSLGEDGEMHMESGVAGVWGDGESGVAGGKVGGESSGFSVLAMGNVQEDVERGRAVREQIKLWDGILEGRIKLHKALSLTNSLPQTSHMPTFLAAGGDRAASSMEHVQKKLTCLLDSLLLLQYNLLFRHKGTHALVGEDGGDDSVRVSDEEVPSDLGSDEDSDRNEEAEVGKERASKCKRRQRKRKWPWRTGGYEEHISAMHTAFESYRDEAITKWDTKLRLASGKLTDKAFVQVDRSTLAQIKHVLQDRGRLVKRTQLKRSVYRVLGKEDGGGGEEASHDGHLKSHDEEIFDEDDFYHQLLRDFIERKMNYDETADPVAMGRQWLALQKLRSKVKKKVDTKASKGRKIRYDVHPKLVGFMAPVEKGTMSNSSRNDLFLSLFGAHSQ